MRSEREDEGKVLLVPVSQDDLSILRPFDLRSSLRQLWAAKLIILAAAVVATSLGLVYALLATEWYRAEVLLAPADAAGTSVVPGELRGLASLAGIGMQQGDASDEAIAILSSRSLAKDFIQDRDLLPVFFADEWDESQQRWRAESADEWRDSRDGVRFFEENVRSLSQEATTGLVTLGITWIDPEVAAEWANALVEKVNAVTREKALEEAAANIEFLQAEIGRSQSVALQQATSRLLESELQKLMLARGKTEFAFRVLDPAIPPKYRDSPKRAVIVLLSLLIGLTVGVFAALFRGANETTKE